MVMVIQHASGLPALIVDNIPRVLGLLPPHKRNPFRLASDQFPLDVTKVQEIEIASWNPPHQTDQGQQPSCSGHATETAFEASWTSAGLPMPDSPFSGTYVYSFCHGGQNNGAVLSDVCAALAAHGICTEKEAPEGVVFHQQYSADADTVAQRYRPLKVLSVRTYDQILAMASTGWPVVIGIQVGQNFGDLDSEGMAPLPDMVLGGHALPVLGVRAHKKYGLVPIVQNSWTKGWGMNGRCLLRREHFEAQTDAFGIVCPKANPELDNIPEAKS